MANAVGYNIEYTFALMRGRELKYLAILAINSAAARSPSCEGGS